MMITAKKRIATSLADRLMGIARGASVKIALSLESNKASDRATPVCQIINSGKNWAFGRFQQRAEHPANNPQKTPNSGPQNNPAQGPPGNIPRAEQEKGRPEDNKGSDGAANEKYRQGNIDA